MRLAMRRSSLGSPEDSRTGAATGAGVGAAEEVEGTGSDVSATATSRASSIVRSSLGSPAVGGEGGETRSLTLTAEAARKTASLCFLDSKCVAWVAAVLNVLLQRKGKLHQQAELGVADGSSPTPPF